MKRFARKTAAGLVIRNKDVELLAIQGRSVTSRVRVPIEGTEPHHLTEAIQQALGAATLATKKLAVSIPSQDVLFRFFTIPVVPKAEWDSAVQFEARKYIPFKTDSLVWDYRVIPSNASHQLEVIFAAIPRELFRTTQEALAAAGVEPTLIEPRSLSLARLVEPSKASSSNEFVCLVDVEQDMAHLAIVKNHLPYLTRDISFLPSAELPAGRSRSDPNPPEPFQAEALEARGLGSQAGVPLSEQAEFPATLGAQAAGVDARGQRLLSELSVSMNFFMREYPSTSIPRIVLCGDEDLLGPWCHWLSDELHCTVELGSPWLDQHIQGGLPLSFASAVGLLQAAGDPGAVSLNFLKRSLVKAPSAPRAAFALPKLTAAGLIAPLKTPQAAACGGAAVLLLAVLWGVGSLMVSAERRQLERLVTSSPNVGWGLDQMPQEALTSIKEQAAAQVALLKQLMDQRVSVAARLDALARSLPEGVWLTGLAFDDQMTGTGKSEARLVVNGACFLGGEGEREFSAIQKFKEQIKRDPTLFKGFSVAQVSQINAQVNVPRRYTYRTFQLHCTSARPL